MILTSEELARRLDAFWGKLPKAYWDAREIVTCACKKRFPTRTAFHIHRRIMAKSGPKVAGRHRIVGYELR